MISGYSRGSGMSSDSESPVLGGRGNSCSHVLTKPCCGMCVCVSGCADSNPPENSMDCPIFAQQIPSQLRPSQLVSVAKNQNIEQW